jgi:hypothetical protein
MIGKPYHPTPRELADDIDTLNQLAANATRAFGRRNFEGAREVIADLIDMCREQPDGGTGATS